MGQCGDDNLSQPTYTRNVQCDRVANPIVTANIQEDDVVQPIEIHWTLRKIFPNIPSRTSMIIAKFIDIDNNGSIQRSEFNQYMYLLRNAKTQDDLLGIIFKLADQDQSGYIEFDELVQIQLRLSNLDLEINQFRDCRMNYQQFIDFIYPFKDFIVGFHDVWQTGKWGDGKKNTNQRITREEAIRMSIANGSMRHEPKSLKQFNTTSVLAQNDDNYNPW